MKIIRSFWTRLCAWGLGILGLGSALSSCDKSGGEGGGDVYVMYGTPTMEYIVKGKVVDSDKGNGIGGIQVSRPWNSGDVPATTDSDGKFAIGGSDFPNDTIHVKFTDIDGSANGSYLENKVVVDLKQTEKGKGVWDCGKYEAKDVKVKMTKVSD